MVDRSLAPPANFSTNAPPGIDAPSASLRGVPGIDLSIGASPLGGFGVGDSALLGQLGGGLVRNVAGWPSQEVIVQSHTVNPWQNGYHKRITRGQLLFIRRNAAQGEVGSIITLPQMNDILRKGYQIAKSNGVLERQTLDHETWSDVRHAIAEDLEDELDRKRRLLNDNVQDQAKSANMLERVKNVNEKFHTSVDDYRNLLFSEATTQYLRYLSKGGILETWNYIGACRNIEDNSSNFKVLNVAVGGPLNLDNIWGEGLQQGHYLNLILKRRMNDRTAEYEEFQLTPWAEPASDNSRVQSKYPTTEDLYYEDEAGYAQYGVSYTIGKVGRIVTTSQGNNVKARILAGLSNSNDAEADAWRETTRNNKGQVFVSLGKDAWDKSSL